MQTNEVKSNAGNPTPKDPPAVPDHADRTAGGFGGAAPASLDYMVRVARGSARLSFLSPVELGPEKPYLRMAWPS